jgi:hypothetical protein
MDPRPLSDDQKADEARQAVLLLAALTTAEKQRRANFWTDDEPGIMRVNHRTGSWMTIEEEFPQRVRQTIRATKSMLTVFFNPKEFTLGNLLGQGRTFTTAYFIDDVIMPFANQHAHQWEDIAGRKLNLRVDNSKCHTARSVQEETASHRCRCVPHPPHSPNVAMQTSTCSGRQRKNCPGGH